MIVFSFPARELIRDDLLTLRRLNYGQVIDRGEFMAASFRVVECYGTDNFGIITRLGGLGKLGSNKNRRHSWEGVAAGWVLT